MKGKKSYHHKGKSKLDRQSLQELYSCFFSVRSMYAAELSRLFKQEYMSPHHTQEALSLLLESCKKAKLSCEVATCQVLLEDAKDFLRDKSEVASLKGYVAACYATLQRKGVA